MPRVIGEYFCIVLVVKGSGGERNPERRSGSKYIVYFTDYGAMLRYQKKSLVSSDAGAVCGMLYLEFPAKRMDRNEFRLNYSKLKTILNSGSIAAQISWTDSEDLNAIFISVRSSTSSDFSKETTRVQPVSLNRDTGV